MPSILAKDIHMEYMKGYVAQKRNWCYLSGIFQEIWWIHEKVYDEVVAEIEKKGILFSNKYIFIGVFPFLSR